MPDVFSKLNLKDQDPVVVLGAPESFVPALDELSGRTVLRALPRGAVPFLLAFVTRQAEIDTLARRLASRLRGDMVLWVAYPKGTSRTYTCDFNRDTGWEPLGALGLEGVRQVAIDADWSALRFRRVEFIKNMTRDVSRAMSAAGKARRSAGAPTARRATSRR